MITEEDAIKTIESVWGRKISKLKQTPVLKEYIEEGLNKLRRTNPEIADNKLESLLSENPDIEKERLLMPLELFNIARCGRVYSALMEFSRGLFRLGIGAASFYVAHLFAEKCSEESAQVSLYALGAFSALGNFVSGAIKTYHADCIFSEARPLSQKETTFLEHIFSGEERK